MKTSSNGADGRGTQRPPDRFELFEQFCAAAGIKPGAERLGVFLALPELVQDRLWAELAGRLDGKRTA